MSQSAGVENVQTSVASSGSPWATRVYAFFAKEINEIRRQPRLILSLVGGPLLVLGLFGASFQAANPRPRTAVVLPAAGIPGIDTEQIKQLLQSNFDLREVTSDRAHAEELLRAGKLDVVQVLPASVTGALENGKPPTVEFLSNAIDPVTEGWVQYLAYAAVNALNREILKGQTAEAQGEAATVQGQLADASIKIGTFERDLGGVNKAEAQKTLADLSRALDAVEGALPAGAALGNVDITRYRQQLAQARATLDRLNTAVANGSLQQNLNDIKQAQTDLAQLEGNIEVFVRIAPGTLVEPVGRSYINVNERGAAFDSVVFYAPGVVALLVQHTAVTLGALALVRERLMGALEVFRVAPVTLFQLLIGKYLAYTLFIMAIAVILVALLSLIGVPLLGSPLLFLALMLLLTLASLGIGFLISTVSGSDSQAIQLSMITLLVSIFFSGLFITLDSFLRPALAVSYILPMTHGVAGLQNIMLRGLAPDWISWVGLSLITVITFALVLVLFRRQLRKA